MTKMKFLFHFIYNKSFVLIFLWIVSMPGYSQSLTGIMKGKVIDGTTYQTLYGVSVSKDSVANSVYSSSDGYYLLSLSKGKHTVLYSFPGFQTRIIGQIEIQSRQTTHLDIILYPIRQELATKHAWNDYKDSVGDQNTAAVHNSFLKESLLSKYNQTGYGNGFSAIITPENIQPGTDKNGLLLLKRLNGVVLQDNPSSPLIHSLLISGMGERYNQLIYNGSVFSYFDPFSRSYPLQLLPSEAIEEVSVQKKGNASMPSDFAGGTVSLRTKDYADRNFFYIQVGAGFSDGTPGKNFFGDKRSKLEFLGLSGSQRDMPSAFPTTRSESPLSAKNLQEQVYLSRLLKNNLAPVDRGIADPDERVLLGFGKRYKLKKGTKISVIGFINHTKSERIDESIVQVSPNVADNPYPFTDLNKVLIRSQSRDKNYRYTSQLAGIINASIIYGKNKISFRNFLGSQFENTYTRRSQIYKPDEDTLAHDGINYTITQRYFLNTQLSGEHALGENGKFKMNWQASYTYINQQNPDERNFLLRQDSANAYKFELATPLKTLANVNPNFPSILDAVFTNSGRVWRNFTDNNFTGSLNLSFPFNMFKNPQVLSGGIYIQQNYRVFYSDKLLYQGKGFFLLDELIARERYFPGGLTVANFFTNEGKNVTKLNKRDRGNYMASANVGASYLQFDNRIITNLFLQLGIRVESNSQLESSTRYIYFEGYKYPQNSAIDENTRITTFSFLPSIRLGYEAFKKIKINAAYFKTVNRPQLQELIPYSYYDASSFMVKTGNPLLATTDIDNFTAGISYIANAFTDISFGAFHKKIDQPIEYILSGYGTGNILSTPHNTPPATVSGLEASLRVRLNFLNIPWLSGVSAFAKGNVMRSDADAGPIRSTATPEVIAHELSGTPDYSLNTGLVIQQKRLPELSILYSRTGDYIAALGSGPIYLLENGKKIQSIPAYRMKGREQLDIQIAQKLYKNKIQIIAGVNNFLSASYTQYQDLNRNREFDAPITLINKNNGGYYSGGIDNTVISVKQSPTYYFTLSYLFK